nr:hypothetical protein [Tanacetum cinerariifolium]
MVQRFLCNLKTWEHKDSASSPHDESVEAFAAARGRIKNYLTETQMKAKKEGKPMMFGWEKSCGEDEDFNSGSWVSATDYVHATGGIVSGCFGDIKNFLNNRKLDEVVTIVKSCSPNMLGDLTMTMKDILGTIPETIHYKVIDEGGYEKDITVRAALILDNVLIFSPKPSMQYLNITKKSVVKIFRKDTVPRISSG